MQVVDPHVQLWDLERVRLPWLAEPREDFSGDHGKLPPRFTASELAEQAEEIEVLKVVSIEANAADPLAETQWLQAQADETGCPHGIVAMVNLSDPNAEALLTLHAQAKNLRGVRQVLNVHGNPRYAHVHRHYMREPHWRENLKRLARHKLSFELQIYPMQMRLAAELVASNPEICFILNHAGMCVDRHSLAGWREWRDGLRSLAARANVSVKISGLAMFDHGWTIESLRPYVLDVIDAFGPARCMFASNFPIDGLHSSYAELWSTYAEIVACASKEERRAMFITNAERIYRL